jgi:hypothetical protein
VPGLAFSPVLAHFGHWYVSVPTFMSPVLLIAIAVKVSERRAIRRARDGNTSHLPVLVSEREDATTVTVTGAVNYLALLDIERELGVAAGRDLPILLDLRDCTPGEDEFAWSITEAVRGIDDADITVLIGSGEALQELRKICRLEGIKLAEDAAT